MFVVFGFSITFGIGFGLEGIHKQESPSKSQLEILDELKEIKIAINELTRKVDAIQKERET